MRIKLDGKEYEIEIVSGEIKGKEVCESKEELKNLPYVICRTYTAGVFAGYLKSRTEREVVLLNARRIWYWSGAASLSELAMKGTSNPQKCKFPCAVDRVELLDAMEMDLEMGGS